MKPTPMKIDRSSWGRLRVTGSDRVRFLQGLTTVNIDKLADGDHGWGAILSPKGRVLSVIDVTRTGDAFVIACEAQLADKTRGILERYAVMDDVTFEPVTGPAHQVWEDVASVWTAPIVDGAGDVQDSSSDAERLRIRAGFLRYGRDVDEDHFPFETPLGDFIDYGKGCYVGQEPVFRVHAQGNAARALRGLEIDGPVEVSVAPGTQVSAEAKANAGAVTSAVGDGDRTLALAYLHRTVWEPGSTVMVAGRRALIRALPMLLAGCSLITDSFVTNDFSGDQFPIDVETTSGAVVVGVRQSGVPDRVGVLDVLAPLSLVDPGAGVDPEVTYADLMMLGARGAGGALDVPRAALTGAQVLVLHPCQEPECVVGPGGATRPYSAVIGANVLAGDAVRLRLGASQVFVLADIGGEDRPRSYACDAVFPSPYRGGGTLVLAGTELAFTGRRITLQTCLGFDPNPAIAQIQRGADALLVASTATGRTILGASAYARYVAAHADAPALETLPDGVVYLPSGPVTGKLTSLLNLAVVASTSSSPHAPCRQVYAHHLLTVSNCQDGMDCPCEAGDFCSVPAVLEATPPAGIEVLIVGDDNATLQALRTELRPDQPEIDGILGTQAMLAAELDVDYPHDRVLGRCANPGAPECSARPALPERGDRDQVQGCLGIRP